jgi:RNA polymerase sigma factor (sigma-70 family)
MPTLHQENQTRITLLEKIRDQHDNKAWSDFAQYYRKFIYNIIRRMNMNHHDAEEIVQNVMLKSWNKLPEFDYDPGRGRFRGWLCRVTGNEVRLFIRKQKHNFKNISLDDEDTYIKADNFTEPEIEKIAEEEWKHYLPDLAWKNIKSRFEENAKKTFLMLKDNISPKEIAQKLNIAESTVYVHKKRVLDKIKLEVNRLNNEL